MAPGADRRPQDPSTLKNGKNQLRIAYAIQNVDGIDLTIDVGDGVPVKNALNGLRRRGHTVKLIRLRGRSVMEGEDFLRPESGRKMPLGATGSWPFLKAESAVRRLQRALRLPYFALFDSVRFYEACRRGLPAYDVCHEHHGVFGIGAGLACRRLGVPYVLTFSADQFLEMRIKGERFRGIHARLAAMETSMALRYASVVITVSEAARRNLVETWQVSPTKIEVLANGVDLDLFGKEVDPAPIREKLGLDGKPVIVFVGGFQVWHGLDELLASFVRVVEAIPEARLLLVGDGPTRNELQRKATDLGVASSMSITGMIPQSGVPAMLAASDIAVLPYPQFQQELWFSPLKLYEYMAAGKAIVASNSGQISETIRDGENGVLVEAGNVRALADALIGLLQNPGLRRQLGHSARQQAVERHSWTRYVDRLEGVYARALAGAPA